MNMTVLHVTSKLSKTALNKPGTMPH